MKTSQYGIVFTSYTTSTPLKKLKKEIAKKREKEKIKSQNVRHDHSIMSSKLTMLSKSNLSFEVFLFLLVSIAVRWFPRGILPGEMGKI